MNSWKIMTRDVIYKIVTNLSSRIKSRVVVLCYHSFDNSNWRFSVNLKQLETQIKMIAQRGSFISAEDLNTSWNYLLENKFLITIDDGYQNVLSTVEIFKKYNVKPLLFVIADTKNVNRKELDTQESLLNVKEIKTLIKAGWEIGCHSMSHADFSSLSSDQIEHEVILSKKLLEDKLGIKIDYFAYPKGLYTTNIVKAVKKAGYKLAFTMDDARITAQTDKLRIPRVGVDNTHQKSFRDIYSAGSVLFRQAVKASPLKGAIL